MSSFSDTICFDKVPVYTLKQIMVKQRAITMFIKITSSSRDNGIGTFSHHFDMFEEICPTERVLHFPISSRKHASTEISLHF